MNVLIICNIPSPYRVDFFNELGKYVNLTVVFEAKSAQGIKFNWNIDQISNFKAIFLKERHISEKTVNFKILKYIRKNYYDFIIMTNYSYFTEMVALVLLKLRKIPYILEIDGGIIREEGKYKRILKTYLISNALAYFSPSDKSDEYLINYGANKDVIYRYPFTSLRNNNILSEPVSEIEKNSIKQELKIAEKKIVLGVGRFIHLKGFDVLLKSSKGLEENIGVYIIGGKDNEIYSQTIKNYNLKNIYFKDFMDKKMLEKYFKIADVFVLPTRGDVWGLVINEAMSYGVPVISTVECGAAVELINNGKNGFIIEVDDDKSLNKHLITILDDDSLKYEMSVNSLRTIQKYTIENMVKVHLKVFEELEKNS